MPGINQFKGFALTASDTFTPVEWAALTSLLANGFSTGVASTKQVNTLMRQATTVITGVAQFIANQNLDALDNGDPNDFATKLLNAISGASIPPGALVDFGFAGAVPGFIDADGSVPLISSVPSLAAAIYCGDANNATASWGYRCTNPASPTTTRSTAGTYIVLLDSRGRFRRTLSSGSSLDAGRSLWSYQTDDNKAHTHSLGTLRDNNDNVAGNLSAGANFGSFGTYDTQSSGTESRPFNYAATTKFKL